MKKKGLATMQILTYLFAFFFIAIFLGIGLYFFMQIDQLLDMDVNIGQVNLAEANAYTFGKMTSVMVDNADMIGVILIFSLILTMFLNAFFLKSDYPKIFLVIDIFILIFAFILSVYLANAYETYITAVTGTIDTYLDNMPKVSGFVLNMPIYVATIGAIMMILSYSGIGKPNSEANVNSYYG